MVDEPPAPDSVTSPMPDMVRPTSVSPIAASVAVTRAIQSAMRNTGLRSVCQL